MRDYTKIQAWKLRRAAFSIPANIAEGSARESKRDYLHFLYISRGSLMETKYFIHLSRRLGYLGDEDFRRLDEVAGQTFACLQGLIQAVERESGKLAKVTATLTSLVVLGIARFGFWPLVSGLLSLAGIGPRYTRSLVFSPWSPLRSAHSARA